MNVWLHQKWALNIRDALRKRADDHLCVTSTKLQTVYRAACARQQITSKVQANAYTIYCRFTKIAATKIQKRLARGPAARVSTLQLAMGAFQKYLVGTDEILQYGLVSSSGGHAIALPKNSLCYWAFVGPKSGAVAHRAQKMHVSWSKPKLLRDGDVDRVLPRPNQRTVFIVNCAFCGVKPAERVCLDACADPSTFASFIWKQVCLFVSTGIVVIAGEQCTDEASEGGIHFAPLLSVLIVAGDSLRVAHATHVLHHKDALFRSVMYSIPRHLHAVLAQKQ